MDSHQTIIIGAGPAGLAVGACLKRAGVPVTILEHSDKLASSWRGHYDRLHLHTAKAFSELPFARFPAATPRFPSRMQVIDYLEAYARQFDLLPLFRQQVLSVRPANGAWEVRTRDQRYEAANVVVATGYNREPYCPSWPGQGSFDCTILHSSQYRNGEPFRGQRALVVGFGNSGGEIAIDLWEHGAQPSLAVRSAVNVIPRELLGIPILAIAIVEGNLPAPLADALNAAILRVAIGDLAKHGLRKLPRGPLTQIQRDARIPLIDVGTLRLIEQGHVAVRPGIQSFVNDGVVFTDGRQERYDAVILATGYRPRVDAFLHGGPQVYDENGTPLVSGREAALPGLYFCGYYVSPTGMLREIAIEARRIAAAIARKQQVPA